MSTRWRHFYHDHDYVVVMTMAMTTTQLEPAADVAAAASGLLQLLQQLLVSHQTH